MAQLTKARILEALRMLGELATGEGRSVELVVLGGAFMALHLDARVSTEDVDVVILHPSERSWVRGLAESVAERLELPKDWLNEGAKGFLVGLSEGPYRLEAPGIRVGSVSLDQMLAMKICAWRDPLDVADAGLLLAALAKSGDKDAIWDGLARHLLPGRELTARYAYDDLWDEIHGPS